MMKILIGSSIIVILLSIFAAMRLLTISIQPEYEMFYFVLRIEDLKPKLEREWPSLACPKQKDSSLLWKGEWEKHGKCSISTLTQHGYFDAALKLKAKKNLLHILQDAKIEPNGNMYSYDAILEALIEGIGFVPGISCNEEKSSKTPQLYEVIICVDHSGSNFMNCPLIPRIKSCEIHQKIKFPKFGVRSSELKAEL